MSSHRLHARFAPVVLVLALSAAPAFAQDEDAFDRTPEDCLSTAAIARTKVIDDQTILFYMRGKRVYRNYLPRKCPSLERQERFMYEARGGRVCDSDTITVLEQWGARLQPGFTCPLGAFQPITPEEAEDLQLDEETHEGPGRDAIRSEPVELPADEPADAPPAPEETDGGSDATAPPAN